MLMIAFRDGSYPSVVEYLNQVYSAEEVGFPDIPEHLNQVYSAEEAGFPNIPEHLEDMFRRYVSS